MASGKRFVGATFADAEMGGKTFWGFFCPSVCLAKMQKLLLQMLPLLLPLYFGTFLLYLLFLVESTPSVYISSFSGSLLIH